MLATSEEVIVNLFQNGTRLTYQKGGFVIRPGETPPGIFYIAKGLVKAYSITKYGEENLLVIRKEGDILGLTWGLTGRTHSIIYSALVPSELIRISLKQFEDHLDKHPRTALPLLGLLAEMYRIHSERILNLEYRSVRERILFFLLSTAERFGHPVQGGTAIGVPLRHQDIASSISATRETTSRELAILERQGIIIKNSQSSVVLLDPDRIKNYLGHQDS